MKSFLAVFVMAACFVAANAGSLPDKIPESDAPPVDAALILQSLKILKAKQEQSERANLKRAIEEVFAASGSKEAAIAFYEDAIMATQFAGSTRENRQFRNWKESEDERLSNTDFRESVRMHLFYLGISLRRASGVKVADLLQQLTGYVKLLDNSEPAVNVKGSLLRMPVGGGLFAKWLRLEPWLGSIDKWEMNPGNSDGVATKIILPELRATKSPALIGYWDGRIARDSARAVEAKLDFQVNDFSQIKLPQLCWNRAKEWLVLGQKNRAITEMFGIVQQYPEHPDTMTWIRDLEGLLVPSQSMGATSSPQ